jgi:glycosyltransferase involved in cell wall biosynthesis
LQVHGSLPRIGAKQQLKWIYDVLFGYRLLRDASKVIALTRVEAEQYRRMGVPEEKIAIIPNGIDLSEYAELPPKGVFKKKFNIPEDRKIILYLGQDS